MMIFYILIDEPESLVAVPTELVLDHEYARTIIPESVDNPEAVQLTPSDVKLCLSGEDLLRKAIGTKSVTDIAKAGHKIAALISQIKLYKTLLPFHRK